MGFLSDLLRARSHYRHGPYQRDPGCRIDRRRYVGVRPDAALIRRTFLGFPRRALCGGCWKEVALVHGRIPPHDPAPPKYRKCVSCGAPVPPNYNGAVCATCAFDVRDLDGDDVARIEGVTGYGAW
jgi:hypothetical protein